MLLKKLYNDWVIGVWFQFYGVYEMPVLRKGVSRRRATLAQPQQGGKQTRRSNRGRKRAAEEEIGRPRTRLAAKILKEENKVQVLVVAPTGGEDREFNQQVSLVSERGSDIERKELVEVDIGKEGGMGDDSGGLSANRAVGQEEEGNTAPFPERVWLYACGFGLSIIYVMCFFGTCLVIVVLVMVPSHYIFYLAVFCL